MTWPQRRSRPLLLLFFEPLLGLLLISYSGRETITYSFFTVLLALLFFGTWILIDI
jgi:lipopolysaccharide export LptBFGC system permease protein LptF